VIGVGQGTFGVIDTVVHPAMPTDNTLVDYLDGAYATYLTKLPPPSTRHIIPAPTGIPPYGEWLEEARPQREPSDDDGGELAGGYRRRKGGIPLAGSRPATTVAFLDAGGVERAILLPFTRGLQPDVDFGSAICAATNRWLAETWLADDPDGRFLGTIRVNAMDPIAAVKEIETWGDHPRMVQIGIPTEAHRPYGQRNYLPIWEAAAACRLPVAVKADNGVGVDYFPTLNGLPRTHIEFSALHRDRSFFHLSSLIAEGVFERFPELRFVFVDGGFDLAVPLMWRMDMDYPIAYIEVPWLTRTPGDYLEANVRFVVDRMEGPPDDDAALVDEWLERSGGVRLLLYGSRYPHWSTLRPAEAVPGSAESVRRRLLRDNAVRWYGPRLGVQGSPGPAVEEAVLES
jgi:uncharacterized protein